MAYEEAVKLMKQDWDPKFVHYYETYVEKNIDMSGWWSAKLVGWKVKGNYLVKKNSFYILGLYRPDHMDQQRG